jgi:3'-phosphoadenosine 5'-phosphosulfate sulfotransferase (PAPS reductase)/FAD synthetase
MGNTKTTTAQAARLEAAQTNNFADYDKVIVAYSGGKDSTACVLHLLELGCPKAKMELWHHDIDGRPADGANFFDWPVTADYCRKFAQAVDIDLLFSWKIGGFEGELLRNESPTAATAIELSDGSVVTTGGAGKPGTRLKFPAQSANLSTRWCSAYLKIDVGEKAFRNDPRYKTGTFLFVTGERREESAARAKYNETESYRASSAKRDVTQWRAIIDWSEGKVWEIMERHGINPHPAYKVGYGRVSCATCIFGNCDQWATVKDILPRQFEAVAQYEEKLGHTIAKGITIREQAEKGTRYELVDAMAPVLCGDEDYTDHAVVAKWTMPAGAFKTCGGPS